MKKRLLATIMSLAMITCLTACGNPKETTEVAIAVEAPAEIAYTHEDVDKAIYEAVEDERNAQYGNSRYWDNAIPIVGSPEYIKISIPTEFISAGVESISDGVSVNAPVVINGIDMTLTVSCMEYNYDNGKHAEAVINQRANFVNEHYYYEIVSMPNGSGGSYKFIYEKKGTDSYSSKKRIACKAKNWGNGVVYMELATDMMGGNMDNILSIEKAFEVLDAINIGDCADEATAQQINARNNSSSGDEFITFNNPFILEAVQRACGVDSGSITKEKAKEIKNLNIYVYFAEECEDRYAYALQMSNLEELKHFENLEELTLEMHMWIEDDKDVPIIDFTPLENMENMRRLCFNIFYFSEDLEYTGGQIVVQNYDWMKNMKKLEDIYFSLNATMDGLSTVWDNDLNIFSGMNELRALYIYETVNAADSQLYQTVLPTDLSPLANLHNLHSLGIHTAATDISALACLENLDRIEMWSNVPYETAKEVLKGEEKFRFENVYLPEWIEERLEFVRKTEASRAQYE